MGLTEGRTAQYSRGGYAARAYVAERAVHDASGNPITSTYAKIEDYEGKLITEMEEQPNAGFHNSFFRGKDLTSLFASGEIYDTIADGTFIDRFVGDFFTAGGDVYIIAGLDMLWGNGDSDGWLQQHHAVILPESVDKPIYTAKSMNATNDTSTGYVSSTMFTTTLPSINTALEAVFGNHLIAHRELLTTSVESTVTPSGNISSSANGAANNWAWSTCKANLMSPIELMGTRGQSSSGYDIGTAKSQFPLFRLAPEYIFPNAPLSGSAQNERFWLKSVANATSFCVYDELKELTAAPAGELALVRPYFLIG